MTTPFLVSPHPLQVPFQPCLFRMFQPEWSFPNTHLHRVNSSTLCLKTAGRVVLTLTLAPRVACTPSHLSVHALPPSGTPAPGPLSRPSHLPSSLLPQGLCAAQPCPECSQPRASSRDWCLPVLQISASTDSPTRKARPGKEADVQSKLNSAPSEHTSHFVIMPSLVGIFAESVSSPLAGCFLRAGTLRLHSLLHP